MSANVEEVIELIRLNFCKQEGFVITENTLLQDLDIDSLSGLEMLFRIEELYKIQIDEAKYSVCLQDGLTIGQLVIMINENQLVEKSK